MAKNYSNYHVENLVNSLKNKNKIRILYVCLGNICRSPAAEGVMRAIVEAEDAGYRFELDSAGTGGYHVGELPDSRMRIHARRRGYELTHRCRKIMTSDFDNFDIIVAMDASNEANIKRLAPDEESERKIVRMTDFVDLAGNHYDHVPDPYYEGAEGFELVLDLLENGCRNMFDALTRQPD